MKNNNRLLAAIIAAVMMPSVNLVSTNALYVPSDESKLEGFTKIERGEYNFLEPIFAYYNNEIAETYFVPGAEVYLSNTDTRIIVKNVAHYSLLCDTYSDTTESIISELMENYDVDFDIITYTENTQLCIRIKASFISNSELRSIKDTLSDFVSDIKVRYYASNMEFGYRNSVIQDDFLAFSEKDKEKAENYLTEKGITFNTEIIENKFSEPTIKLIPEKEMSHLEKAALYDEIIITTGFKDYSNDLYGWFFPESSTEALPVAFSIINNTNGDANCDDKVTVSDAVAVLQYIANKEKYPLNAQGEFNADIDSEDGITGGDAIAIQKIDAGIL